MKRNKHKACVYKKIDNFIEYFLTNYNKENTIKYICIKMFRR